MKAEDLIFDVLHIATMSTVTKDTRLDELYILQKLNQYRAIRIPDQFRKLREINPLWIQSMEIFDITKTNSADDDNLLSTSICMGKITLPPVVAIEGNLGLKRVGGSSGQTKWYPIDKDKFYQMYEANDFRLVMFIHYIPLGSAIYVYPYQSKGVADIIAENPLDVPVKRSEYVLTGSIATGESYTVYVAQVTYNAVVYNVGDTFTGVVGVTAFTGPGKVKYTNMFRTRTILDPYPIDLGMAEMCIMDVLTKDLNIERQQIADIVADSQDQLKILSNYGALKR